MTYDFGHHFTQELGNRFGPDTGSWPATAERVTPFLTIVVNALGADEGLRWFEAARKAHLRVTEAERNRSYNFGFAHYLDTATGARERHPARARGLRDAEGRVRGRPARGQHGERRRVLRVRGADVLTSGCCTP
ncbi:hypothetical protein [Streptomyces sp. NPDC059611]|uniref:hypothetical protein n=1 Tax=Streptomyces sp. NPDC059611 TaxID=3346884 RepID=UPI0036C898F6